MNFGIRTSPLRSSLRYLVPLVLLTTTVGFVAAHAGPVAPKAPSIHEVLPRSVTITLPEGGPFDLERSNDNGATWQQVPGAIGIMGGTTIEDDELSPGTVYIYRVVTAGGSGAWGESAIVETMREPKLVLAPTEQPTLALDGPIQSPPEEIVPAEGMTTRAGNTLRLKQVVFEDNYTVLGAIDDGSYDAPHWLDKNGDGAADSERAGDRHYPVCYASGRQMKASATFIVKPSKGNWRVKAGGAGFTFPSTRATVSGSTLSVGPITCRQKFAAKVGYFNPLTLNWAVSRDGGKTWRSAGTSANQLYVTLGTPGISLNGLFHTVLDVGGRNANGLNSKSAIFNKIWSDFNGPMPGVQHANGTPMSYWGTTAKGDKDICFTTHDLLKYQDGKCGAWTRFFVDALRVHNITAAYRETIEPTYRSNLTDPIMVMSSGLVGQNNPNPKKDFSNHSVVKLGRTIYDPSYGNAYAPSGRKSAELVWEDASLESIVHFDPASNRHVTFPDRKGKHDTIFSH